MVLTCTLWVASGALEASWTVRHLEALVAERWHRNAKGHACSKHIETFKASFSVIGDPLKFVNCTPFKHLVDVHEAYKLTLRDKWTQDRKPKWTSRGQPIWGTL